MRKTEPVPVVVPLAEDVANCVCVNRITGERLEIPAPRRHGESVLILDGTVVDRVTYGADYLVRLRSIPDKAFTADRLEKGWFRA